jgi:hypothetical protein
MVVILLKQSCFEERLIIGDVILTQNKRAEKEYLVYSLPIETLSRPAGLRGADHYKNDNTAKGGFPPETSSAESAAWTALALIVVGLRHPL